MHIILFPFSLSRKAMRQNHLLSVSRISSCLPETVSKLTVSQFRYQPLLTFLSVNGGVQLIKYKKTTFTFLPFSPTSSSRNPLWIFKAWCPSKSLPTPSWTLQAFLAPLESQRTGKSNIFSFHIPPPLPQVALPCRCAPVGSHTLSAGFSGKSGVKLPAKGREDMNQDSICLITRGSQARP